MLPAPELDPMITARAGGTLETEEVGSAAQAPSVGSANRTQHKASLGNITVENIEANAQSQTIVQIITSPDTIFKDQYLLSISIYFRLSI